MGRASRSAVVVRASASQPMARRELLSAAGAALVAASGAPLLAPLPAAAESKYNTTSVPVEQLGLVQKQGQLKDFRVRADAAIKTVLTAADAPAAVRLLLADASPYDIVTKTGGVDGSIVLPEELARPENAGLQEIVDKLAKVKAIIDEGGAKDGSGPISWADTIVLAAKTTTQLSWSAAKIKKALLSSGGEVIAGPAFAAAWPVRLGRVDATTPNPAVAPAPGAPVKDITAFYSSLAVKPGTQTGGLFGSRPPFWERPTFVLWTAAAADPAAEEARFVAEAPELYKGWKVNYDRSRATLTRTDYEVDFIDFFTVLAGLATFKKDAYLHPEQVIALF